MALSDSYLGVSIPSSRQFPSEMGGLTSIILQNCRSESQALEIKKKKKKVTESSALLSRTTDLGGGGGRVSAGPDSRQAAQ